MLKQWKSVVVCCMSLGAAWCTGSRGQDAEVRPSPPARGIRPVVEARMLFGGYGGDVPEIMSDVFGLRMGGAIGAEFSVVEVTSHVKELRRGKVVKETATVSYAATNLSPGQANAKVLGKLLRRHWMIENRNHYVRDNRWREDRATWRSGDSAFVMFLLLPKVRLLRTYGLP